MEGITMGIFTQFKNFYKKLHLKFLKLKYRKYLKTSHNSSGVKNIVGNDFSIRFDCAFEDKKKEVEKKVETLVKKAKNNPYRLIAYIEKHGTPVYKIKNADKILSVINETEGFITPKRGLKAIYLNAVINKKLSTRFEECFIMRNLSLDPYYTIHQFYSWYAFKSGFAGYEFEAQEKLKKLFCSKNRCETINNFGISDILEVKEAINRDKEALDFVIRLATNTDGAKNAFNKMIMKTSAVNV